MGFHAAARRTAARGAATGITLSEQQHAHVRARVEQLGLDDSIEVRQQDYRELHDGTYDAIATVEMGEHVGERNYAEYAATLYRNLRPQGRLLLQQMSRGNNAPGGGAFIESLHRTGHEHVPAQQHHPPPGKRRIRDAGCPGDARALHLAIHGEDHRYRAMLARAKSRPRLRMFLRTYLTQAAVMWFVSLPGVFAQCQPDGIGLLGALGTLVWCVGFAFEAIGDQQLRRFTADPTNPGRVLDQGLWRYTRHPNYFGDACVWWGCT